MREEITGENAARDAAKVDAQIADTRAVRHHEVRRDPDQQLVQSESLGPKSDQLDARQARESCEFLDGCEVPKNVLGTE